MGGHNWTDPESECRIVGQLSALILQHKDVESLGAIRIRKDKRNGRDVFSTVLIEACQRISGKLVAKCLAVVPEVDINFQETSQKRTALMCAILNRMLGVCEKLLSRIPEIDLDLADSRGNTAEQYLRSGSSIVPMFAQAKQSIAEYRANAAVLALHILSVYLVPKELVHIIFHYLAFTIDNFYARDSFRVGNCS